MGGGGVPNKGVKLIYAKKGSLPTRDAIPNFRYDLILDDKRVQSRWFDDKGRVVRNRDYDHQNPHENHFFPHDHMWEWNGENVRRIPENLPPDNINFVDLEAQSMQKQNQSEYEQDKQKKKQKLVRNEFLYHGLCSGKYDIPIIRKQNINVEKINFVGCSDPKEQPKVNKTKTMHFFTYDWLFSKYYDNPEENVENLKEYYAVLSPDFSLFTNMPLALQIESVYKNRWCGAYWQSKGIDVIPSISWSDERSFDFCFDGVEEGSIVAVCTYYREGSEEEFLKGYNIMLEKIKPSLVLCYDRPFDGMLGNIKSFVPTRFEFVKNLEPKEQVRFLWEKENKVVSGLNKNDFKYFKYEDPFEKNRIKKCSVCANAVVVDQFENGECENCHWKSSMDEEKFEKLQKISYPNLVPLSRAREQYSMGKPFKATFEDFMNGLDFYSEMLFEHNDITYEVFKTKDSIVFCSKDMQQEYISRDEFEKSAHIGTRLLVDIWDEVQNAGFMYCG